MPLVKALVIAIIPSNNSKITLMPVTFHPLSFSEKTGNGEGKKFCFSAARKTRYVVCAFYQEVTMIFEAQWDFSSCFKWLSWQ